MEDKSIVSIDNLIPICEVFVKSGIFEDIKDVSQAIVKVAAGKELGLSPIESMMGLYIVKNRIAASAKIISSLIKKSKVYDYKVEKLDENECSIAFYRTGKNGEPEAIGVSTFTIKDAARAGIVNGVNWKNYPRNMLFARALSNGSRWYCPDVFCGYSTEEIEEVGVELKKDIVVLSESGEVKGG